VTLPLPLPLPLAVRRLLAVHQLGVDDPPSAETWRSFLEDLAELPDVTEGAYANGLERARLSAVLGSLSAGVIIEDRERRTVLVNQPFCDIFAVPAPPAALVGVDCAAAAVSAAAMTVDADAFIRRIDELLAAAGPGGPEPIEFKGGRTLERTYSPVRLAGEVAGHIWQYRDITVQTRHEQALRAASEEAERAGRAKDDFLASMSHELRSPLTSVLGLTELLLEHADAASRPSLSVILQSGTTLLALLNELLDLSKLRAGKFSLIEEEVDVGAVVEDATAALAVNARRKNLTLRTVLCPELPRAVVGDGLRLRQVLTNLVDNAIKFTPRGDVVVTVEVDDAARVRFGVRDEGPGLDAEQQSRLFQSFERLDTAWSRAERGTGLGLSIAQGLVAKMGGTIEIVSQVGVGTTFSFSIPMPHVASAGPEGDASDNAETTRAPTRLRVLVAEDDAASRLFLERALERLGHEVHVVCDGQAVLDRLGVDRGFDAILMDVQMPVLDGLATTRAVRRLEGEGAHTPILALTASAMRGDRERCLEAGVDAHVPKPVSLEALDAALARATGTGRAARSPRRTPTLATGALDLARIATLRALGEDVLAGLLEEYDVMLTSILEALSAALRERQWGDARRLAHKLRGSSETIGATRLGEVTSRIEQAVDTRAARPDALVDELREAAIDTRAALAAL